MNKITSSSVQSNIKYQFPFKSSDPLPLVAGIKKPASLEAGRCIF